MEVNNFFHSLKNSDYKLIILLQKVKYAILDYHMKNLDNWISEVICVCVIVQCTKLCIKTVCWDFLLRIKIQIKAIFLFFILVSQDLISNSTKT